jgi:hypothetical protein
MEIYERNEEQKNMKVEEREREPSLVIKNRREEQKK